MIRGDAVGVIAKLNVWVTELEIASFTSSVKLKVPAIVGVPVINPVLDIDNPEGRVPEINNQV